MPILGSNEDQAHKLALYGEDNMRTRHSDLIHYLRGEFQQGEPLRITVRRTDAVGMMISDRMVSRLEVHSAIGRLHYRQRRVIELTYCECLPRPDVAAQLGISERTVDSERSEAIAAMVDRIYEWHSPVGTGPKSVA